MKISYNWLCQYLDIDLPIEQVSEILTDIGLEVEGMETHESIKGGLKGIVIGHVLEREQHPNADRLSVTKVDLGTGEPAQIVCGAPNVAAGQKVVVATVGATLYPSDGEEFKIKKSKIRGVESHGMICAEDEIGLGESHDGIMVLDGDAQVGMSAGDYFNIETDTIIEIGLTPNRSDATSHIGVAKDLAAYLNVNHVHSGEVRVPSVEGFDVQSTDVPIEVVVENTEGCPRYSGVIIKNLNIKESPEWLKNRLTAIGVKTINNVVDITNFILHELGQPLHAFDYREITDKKIIVKNLPKGTKFLSLDEVERTLHEEDLMICDGQENGMCIGGVFGGIKSGVKDDTTTIFLESAYFHPTMIRRTSTRHLLRTDAAKTFEKGTDPNGTVYALKRAALLLQELAGGQIASEIIDIYPTPVAKKQVTARFKRINTLIGAELSQQEIVAILSALEMDIVEVDADAITVAVPTNKFDVTREADIIEEILRIYGLNKVEMSQQVSSALSYTPRPDEYTVQNRIADLLTAGGYYETMSLSITQSKYTQEVLPFPDELLVYINNTSNQGLDIMRPTMLYGGLEAIAYNQNRQNTDLKFYEFGRTYIEPVKGEYQEDKHLALFLTGQLQSESWRNTGKAATTFYDLKAQVENILARTGVEKYQVTQIASDVFAYGLKFHRGKQVLVEFGRLHTKVCKAMGVKQEVFYADFAWDNLLKALKNNRIIVADIPKTPAVRRDLALVINKNISFGEIEAIARKQGKKLLKDVNLFDVFEDESKLGQGKKSYAVSFVFQDDAKTLKDKEIEKIMSKMIRLYEDKLQAVIRK